MSLSQANDLTNVITGANIDEKWTSNICLHGISCPWYRVRGPQVGISLPKPWSANIMQTNVRLIYRIPESTFIQVITLVMPLV